MIEVYCLLVRTWSVCLQLEIVLNHWFVFSFICLGKRSNDYCLAILWLIRHVINLSFNYLEWTGLFKKPCGSVMNCISYSESHIWRNWSSVWPQPHHLELKQQQLLPSGIRALIPEPAELPTSPCKYWSEQSCARMEKLLISRKWNYWVKILLSTIKALNGTISLSQTQFYLIHYRQECECRCQHYIDDWLMIGSSYLQHLYASMFS